MQPADSVRELYEAFADRDIGRVLELCSDEISFDWSPDTQHSKHSGRGHGKAAFLEHLAALGDDFEYQSMLHTDVIAEGDRVAVQVEARMTGRATGRSILLRGADFWTVREGKIVDFVQYYDSALAASVLA